jgi:uncharacterized RDD family membrane protein YckC
MFCTRCGTQVNEGHRFCQACGLEVGPAPIAAPVAGPAPPVTVPTPPATPAAPPVDVPPPYAAASVPPPPPVIARPPIPPALPYAGFWERFAAYLIDGMILGIPFGIVVIVLIFMFGGFGMMLHRTQPVDPREAVTFLAPMFLIFISGMFFFIVLQWLYSAGLESSGWQATVGKSVMNLRVTNLEGRRISFGHATGRFFAKIVSGLIPLAIGYIMAAFTERKQALHDLIAGTLVLKK